MASRRDAGVRCVAVVHAIFSLRDRLEPSRSWRRDLETGSAALGSCRRSTDVPRLQASVGRTSFLRHVWRRESLPGLELRDTLSSSLSPRGKTRQQLIGSVKKASATSEFLVLHSCLRKGATTRGKRYEENSGRANFHRRSSPTFNRVRLTVAKLAILQNRRATIGKVKIVRFAESSSDRGIATFDKNYRFASLSATRHVETRREIHAIASGDKSDPKPSEQTRPINEDQSGMSARGDEASAMWRAAFITTEFLYVDLVVLRRTT